MFGFFDLKLNLITYSRDVTNILFDYGKKKTDTIIFMPWLTILICLQIAELVNIFEI